MLHVDRLLEIGMRRGARDICLVPGARPMLRFADDHVSDAGVHRLLSEADVWRFMHVLLPEDAREELETQGFTGVDMAYGNEAELYVAARRTRNGTVINIRLEGN